MEEKELKSITIIIGGRSYPVRVDESKVGLIQSAGKKINEQLRFFQSTYKERDLQDCLSMTLLTMAMELVEKPDTDHSSLIDDQLRDIDQILQTALN